MLFMVEFRLKPGAKNKAVEAFEQRGPNRIPGVAFEKVWIGNHSDVAYVLIQSADEALVAKAAELWSEFGQTQIHSVVDIQQY
jgi:hypothetical protein